MEHLALEIFDLPDNNAGNTALGSKYANLQEDASITIIDTSEIFASGDVWTHQFTLNIPANAHIFGTSGELHGGRLHEQINKRRARLWVMGLPLYYGYLRLEDEVDVDADGNVDVSFESGQKTFRDLIDGAKANQVPLMSDVMIGMALWRKRSVRWLLRLNAQGYYSDGSWAGSGKVMANDEELIDISSDGDVNPTQQYPRMVFPKGQFYDTESDNLQGEPVDCLNTDTPYTENAQGYPINAYCNISLCYQKKGYPETEGGKTDYSKEPESKRGYEVMPANRVNSAPNFYVIYWLRSLMKYLDIHVSENQMMDVQDLRRLFFVNTKCAYEEIDVLRNAETTERYGKFQFLDQYNYLPEKTLPRGLINTEECAFTATNITYIDKDSGAGGDEVPDLSKVIIKVDANIMDWDKIRIDGTNKTLRDYYRIQNSYLHRAYATSECFPDEDIDAVIDMLENAFGVRFLFSGDYKSVRIVLLRNLLRNQEVQEISCEVVAAAKMENCIRGFRMTYGAGSEDTAFYYKGFADMLPSQNEIWIDKSDKHDYSIWQVDAQYKDVINKVSAFNKTCYVCPSTGNAYGIKVDKDARRYEDLHPSLFGFADFMDAEDGDCTGGEETVKEINVGFKPAIMNDLNMAAERGDGDNHPVEEQHFALFVGEEMRPRRPDLSLLAAPASYNDSDAVYDVDGELYRKADGQYKYSSMMADGVVQPGVFAITSDSYCEITGLTATIEGQVPWVHPIYDIKRKWEISFDIHGHINEGYRLYLQDNYEPNDEGVPPVEAHEWGITLGIMRGSGEDAYVGYSEDPDDGEGNDTWDIVPGSNATAHPDTCDDYGKIFDYNGSANVVASISDATSALRQLWPDSNINLVMINGLVPRIGVAISGAACVMVEAYGGKNVMVLLALQEGNRNLLERNGVPISEGEYLRNFRGMTPEQMFAWDADTANGGLGVLIEVGSSAERMNTLLMLEDFAFNIDTQVVAPIIIDENGVGSLYGRFSLKLRAEKPNPFFDPTQPEEVIYNKEQAASAMQRLFTSANTDLLDRPLVSNATIHAAGWDALGNGYATVFGVGIGVRYDSGAIHEILWTPIKEDGSVLTKSQLQSYVNGFNNLSPSAIVSHDTLHLILDIDTTESRADLLHKLQAIYYAADGDPVESVKLNPRYLEISNPNLRGRGLADQFYKEYSYWVRNARIASITATIGLAELLSIDKTKRQRIGDITGFIKKMQYTVGKKTGLGMVEMEVLYL